jgi:hypothetical protein
MAEMHLPVVKTSMTTMIGLLSFALSPLAPVRAFGLFGAVGMLYCMLFSLAVVPAVLALGRPGLFVSPGGGTDSVLGASVEALSRFFIRRRPVAIAPRVVAIALLGLVALLAPFGIARIEVQDSWIDGFDPESEFYQATQRFNEGFFGTHQLFVLVDTGREVHRGTVAASRFGDDEIRVPAVDLPPPQRLIGRMLKVRRAVVAHDGGAAPETTEWSTWIEDAALEGDDLVLKTPARLGSGKFALRLEGEEPVEYEVLARRLTSPDVLAQIDRLAEFISNRGAEKVGGVLAPSDYLETTRFIISKRDENAREVPEDPEAIYGLWRNYEAVRGEARRREVVDGELDRALVTVFLKNANFADTASLMARIRDHEANWLADEGIRLAFAGDVAVSQSLIDGIVSTEVRALAFSLLGILAVTALLCRSLLWGAVCVVPCVVSVLSSFAVMGWLGVPLGVATSMFAVMTLGVGVDYAIHVVERARAALRRGAGRGEAAAEAMRTTLGAVTLDTVAVAAAFGLLVSSQVPANARLGLIVTLSLIGCYAATVLFVPALVPGRVGRRSRSPGREGSAAASGSSRSSASFAE